MGQSKGSSCDSSVDDESALNNAADPSSLPPIMSGLMGNSSKLQTNSQKYGNPQLAEKRTKRKKKPKIFEHNQHNASTGSTNNYNAKYGQAAGSSNTSAASNSAALAGLHYIRGNGVSGRSLGGQGAQQQPTHSRLKKK